MLGSANPRPGTCEVADSTFYVMHINCGNQQRHLLNSMPILADSNSRYLLFAPVQTVLFLTDEVSAAVSMPANKGTLCSF